MTASPSQYLKQLVVPGIWRTPGGADGTSGWYLKQVPLAGI